MDNIKKTTEYLLKMFDDSEYFEDKPNEKQYRLDHTFRVANIGKEIAQRENMDVDAIVVGCLLHDLGYIQERKTREEHLAHGRASAKIARDFVMGLDLKKEHKHELLYGIAIHVDDKSDFEGNRTKLAETISDCDNIDRFDRYRLYEALKYSDLDKMSLSEQIDFTSKKIKRLKELKDFKFSTKTAVKMWEEKLDYQIEYFEGLLEQLHKSDFHSL